MSQRPDHHLIPLDDAIRHYDSSLCGCHPSMEREDEDGFFWVHNALDGRETHPDMQVALTGWALVSPGDTDATKPSQVNIGLSPN